MKRKKNGKKENIGKKNQEGVFGGYTNTPFSEDVLIENKGEEVVFYEENLNFEEDWIFWILRTLRNWIIGS